MPRPKGFRRVAGAPICELYKPAGVPASQLGEIVLELDEMEAIRLADAEGMYHVEAARVMHVSRQTFGRILESGRRKVANALTRGLALRIKGGRVKMADMRVFRCRTCNSTWDEPFGTGRPEKCPECGGGDFMREDGGPGTGGGGQGGAGRGQGRGGAKGGGGRCGGRGGRRGGGRQSGF